MKIKELEELIEIIKSGEADYYIKAYKLFDIRWSHVEVRLKIGLIDKRNDRSFAPYLSNYVYVVPITEDDVYDYYYGDAADNEEHQITNDQVKEYINTAVEGMDDDEVKRFFTDNGYYDSIYAPTYHKDGTVFDDIIQELEYGIEGAKRAMGYRHDKKKRLRNNADKHM